MALFVRKVRQNRWFREDAAPFLATGDVPADSVIDLQTSSNLLSVWEIEPDRSDLSRIVRALALGPQKIDHTGYIVFASDRLGQAEIEIQNNEGMSVDHGINHRHRDLVLSGKKLVALAEVLLLYGELRTMTRPEVLELVEQGIRDGELLEAECRKKMTR
jgi:hypothetical protein